MMPEEYLQVLELMQNRHENVQQRSEDVFVHPCVLPQTTPEQLIRLRNRASPHINFYMQHAPDYFIGMGLICICKLDMNGTFLGGESKLIQYFRNYFHIFFNIMYFSLILH